MKQKCVLRQIRRAMQPDLLWPSTEFGCVTLPKHRQQQGYRLAYGAGPAQASPETLNCRRQVDPQSRLIIHFAFQPSHVRVPAQWCLFSKDWLGLTRLLTLSEAHIDAVSKRVDLHEASPGTA